MNEGAGDDVVLSAQGIGKVFETGHERIVVLNGVHLDIRRGEIIAILGASGAGKSTLLHILGALDRPTEGRVMVDGQDIFSLPDDRIAALRNKTVGFVFQAHHLLPEFTALENVMMPLIIGRMNRLAASEQAAEILKDVGLSERLHHKPGELSGGEQQRVAVARALARSPRVALADEPSGNLDRASGAALLDMIWRLSRTFNQAFVIVTHDEQIGRRADRTFLLMDGRLRNVKTESDA